MLFKLAIEIGKEKTTILFSNITKFSGNLI
jgi:hypothetical protein